MPENRKTNFIIFFIISFLLILFDIYKASHASFTHDESYSYLHYVSMQVVDILSYRNPSPNNHILNSLFMKFFESMFGGSTLVLRLPNILSHVLFLVFTYKLFNRYTKKNFIPFFILVNANPYMIDFFSMARGYGIAIGMMTAGFYFYCRYLENDKQRNHICALILIGLAALGNLVLTNVYVVVILIHNVFQFLVYRRPFTLKNLWHKNKINLIVTVLYSVIFYEPIRRLVKFNLKDDFHGHTGFWHDTVISILSSFIYEDFSYSHVILIFLKIFVIVFFVFFLIRAISYFSFRESIDAVQKGALFFGMIIFFITLSTIVQSMLFETPFLGGRLALFLCPVFILMCCFLLEDMSRKYFRIPVRVVSIFVAAVFSLHTILVLNVNWYNEWLYDMNTKKMLEDLRKSTKEEHVSLGINWLFEPTINFYRSTLNLEWLNPVDRSGIKPENNFYYLAPYDMKNLLQTDVKVIQHYELTGNYLVEPKKK